MHYFTLRLNFEWKVLKNLLLSDNFSISEPGHEKKE